MPSVGRVAKPPSTLGFADIGLESTGSLASLTLQITFVTAHFRASIPILQHTSSKYIQYIAATIETTYHHNLCNTAAWHQSLAHSAGSTMSLDWPPSRPQAAMPTSSLLRGL